MLLDKEIDISPAEWQLWKDHPITKAVLEVLEAERNEWKEMVFSGETLSRPGTQISLTAEAVGIGKGLDIILTGLEQQLINQWEEGLERKRQAKESEDEKDAGY